jgi:uncharacterized surface protein with fasciclin (FAS1) repeats
VAAAVSSKDHQTLVTAVKAAGLVDTLASSGPFTVFAPTDAAFNRLPAGTLNMLLRPANREKLRAVLTYHVVPGAVTSTKLDPHAGIGYDPDDTSLFLLPYRKAVR